MIFVTIYLVIGLVLAISAILVSEDMHKWDIKLITYAIPRIVLFWPLASYKVISKSK